MFGASVFANFFHFLIKRIGEKLEIFFSPSVNSTNFPSFLVGFFFPIFYIKKLKKKTLGMRWLGSLI
jgi:hypothetical protein